VAGEGTGRGEGRRPDMGGDSQIEAGDLQKDSPRTEAADYISTRKLKYSSEGKS